MCVCMPVCACAHGGQRYWISLKLEFTGRCKLPDVKTELGSSARGPDALFFGPIKIFSHIEGKKEEIKDQMGERMGREGRMKKKKRTLILKYF